MFVVVRHENLLLFLADEAFYHNYTLYQIQRKTTKTFCENKGIINTLKT